MLARNVGTILVLIAVAVGAGCTEGPEARSDLQSSNAGPGDGASSHPETALPQSEQVMTLGDCTWYWTSRFWGPAGAPGEAPPGWEPSLVRVVTTWLQFFDCTRVTIDHLERGPVVLLLESHSNAGAPEACSEGSWDYYHMVSGIWVDDSAVAEHMTEHIGHRVGSLMFEDAGETASGRRISWTSDGGSQHELTIRQEGPEDSSRPLLYRFADFTDAGNAVLWHFAISPGINQDNGAAVGAVGPPHLAPGIFAGLGNVSPADAEIEFERFASPTC